MADGFDMSDTIKAKSDQLNADDLIGAIEESDAEFALDRERLLETLREIREDEEAGVEEVTALVINDENQALTRFLAGETPAPDSERPTTDGGSQDREPTVVVQRVAENGTVIETIEIYGNESVRIRSNPNGTPNETTANATEETGRIDPIRPGPARESV